MAWFEVHQSLMRHPKLLHLEELTGTPRITLIGHLVSLWSWALDASQDGGPFKPRDLRAGAEWPGDSKLWTDALITARWIDQNSDGLYIHNWDDYQGRLLAQRAANRDRVRRSRARNAHVTRTSPLGNGATQPNQTVPNRTIPPVVSPPGQETAATTTANDLSTQNPSLGDVSKQEPEPVARTSARAAKSPPAWQPPEWFLPLLSLPGYKHSRHERAVQQIEAACLLAGVSPGDVVVAFAEYYQTAAITNSWTDPVAACKGRPLAIAIKQVAQGRGLSPNGHDPPHVSAWRPWAASPGPLAEPVLDPNDPDWAEKADAQERRRQAAFRSRSGGG